MAGFFKKLFSKEEETPPAMDFSEIAGYLKNLEKEDLEKLEAASQKSKKEVLTAIEDLKIKADSISGAKIPDDSVVAPRVRTVVEKSLPNFSASLLKAMPQNLPENPEEYYASLVETIQAVSKCMRGQGKYIHIVFPAEMKDIKASVDVIGRAINNLNNELKPVMDKKANVVLVRGELLKTESLVSEYSSSVDTINELKSEISSNEDEIEKIIEEITLCRKSPDFLEYEGQIERIKVLEEEKSELSDSYRAAVADVSNVFRKIIYASEREGESEFSKSLFDFDSYLLSGEIKDAGKINKIYSGLYPKIEEYIRKNPGFLKNKSEEFFFSDSDAFKIRISELCNKYNQVKDEISALKDTVSKSQSAEKLSSLKAKMEKLNEESAMKNKKISSLIERQNEISEEYPQLSESLSSALSKLRGCDTIIVDMPQLPLKN